VTGGVGHPTLARPGAGACRPGSLGSARARRPAPLLLSLENAAECRKHPPGWHGDDVTAGPTAGARRGRRARGPWSRSESLPPAHEPFAPVVVSEGDEFVSAACALGRPRAKGQHERAARGLRFSRPRERFRHLRVAWPGSSLVPCRPAAGPASGGLAALGGPLHWSPSPRTN
jgi:hypothetical protein